MLEEKFTINNAQKTSFKNIFGLLVYFCFYVILLVLEPFIGFFLNLIILASILLLKWESINDYLKNLEKTNILTFITSLVLGTAFLILGLFFIAELVLIAVLFYLFGVIFLLLIPIQYLEENKKSFFKMLNLFIPSNNLMIIRLSGLSFLILTISPFLYPFYVNYQLIELIIIIQLFLALLLPLTFIILILVNLKNKNKEKKIVHKGDSVKTVYMYIIALIIYIFNLGLFDSNILFVYSHDFNIENMGIWGFVILFYFVIVALLFSIFGDSSFSNLEKLSLTKERPTGPWIYKSPFLIFLILFFVNWIFSILPLNLFVILSCIIIEFIFIWFLLDLFRNSPDRSYLANTLISVTIYFNLMLLLIIWNASEDNFSYEKLFMIIIPGIFLVINYILANKLFTDFDFIQFLRKASEANDRNLSNFDLTKSVVVESLSYLPAEYKTEVALELIDELILMEGKETEERLKEIWHIIKHKFNLYNLPDISEKLSILDDYSEIVIGINNIKSLPIRENILDEFIIGSLALRNNSFINHGIVVYSFFEGFMKNIHNYLGLVKPIRWKYSGSSDQVIDKLEFNTEEAERLKTVIECSRTARNAYIHRDLSLFKNFENKDHYKHFKRPLYLIKKILYQKQRGQENQ